MVIDPAVALALARNCAPAVAPTTMVAVARAESGLDPLTIGVNGRPHRALHPRTRDEAVHAAQALLANGRNLDLGLAQLNARNLPGLGLSVSAAFDPCRNLAGAADILVANYLAAPSAGDRPQAALRAALSRYNTGDALRGLRNGYVAKVYRAAGQIVPAIVLEQPSPDPEEPVTLCAAAASPLATPAGGRLDPFVGADPALLVWPAAAPCAPPPDATPPEGATR